MTTESEPPKDQAYIFRPWIKKPDGTIIWAKSYGKKAFKIPVSANDNPKKEAV